MKEHFNVICIGSGPGGYTAAIRASQLGHKTAVLELSTDCVGGTCLNEGCIPVKSLIRHSKMFKLVKGDIKKMVADTKRTVSQLKKGIQYLFKQNEITLIEGRASLVDENKIKIELPDGTKKELTADNIIIATGSKTQKLPGFDFDNKRIISSTNAINLEKIPKSISVIGGGAIGIEFAQLFNNFGTKVTLFEMLDRILPQEDEEISKGLETILKRKGIEVFTNTKRNLNDINSEIILVAVGRVPNIDNIGLEDIGIKLNGKFINVDKMMSTSVKNIFAIGDVINSPMFAHSASSEAIIAAEYLTGMSPEPIDYLNVPKVVYGDIEAASIGFTEEEARSKGCNIKISKTFFKGNGRSVINKETNGFIKIIASEETEAILGIHILGDNAAELIHPFLIAKTAGLSVNDLGKVTFAHPTVSEVIKDACNNVFGKAIHG